MPIPIERRLLTKLVQELLHAEHYAQHGPNHHPDAAPLAPYARVPHIVARTLEALGTLPDAVRDFQVTDTNLPEAVALADTLEEPEIYSVTVRFEHDQHPTAHYLIDVTKLTLLADEKYKQAIKLAAAHPRKAAVLQSGLAVTGTFGVSRAAKVKPPCAVVDAVTIWARDAHRAPGDPARPTREEAAFQHTFLRGRAAL